MWSRCVAQTVDHEGAAAYLQSDEEVEQLELAVRRIQARRREKREKRSAKWRSAGTEPSHRSRLAPEHKAPTPTLQDTSEDDASAGAKSIRNQSRYVLQDSPRTDEATLVEEVKNDAESPDCIICLDALSTAGA